MSQFLNGALRRLTPYTPGEQPRNQAYIKLNTNESPYPPSPGVLAALNRAEGENLRLYSDPEAVELREPLATNTFSRSTPYRAASASLSSTASGSE